MKLHKVQTLAAMLSCIGMVMPTAAFANPTAAPQQPAAGVDVALGQGGLFVGQVFNAQGTPQVKAPVSIQFQGREVARTVTDKNGVFAAQGLRGGQYQVVAMNHAAPVRLWAANTAPPATRSAALIVTGSEAVNGQYGNGGGILGFIQAHPMLVAAGVATAIAVPLALADDDDAS